MPPDLSRALLKEIDRRSRDEFVSKRERDGVSDTAIRGGLATRWAWPDTNPVTSFGGRTPRGSTASNTVTDTRPVSLVNRPAPGRNPPRRKSNSREKAREGDRTEQVRADMSRAGGAARRGPAQIKRHGPALGGCEAPDPPPWRMAPGRLGFVPGTCRPGSSVRRRNRECEPDGVPGQIVWSTSRRSELALDLGHRIEGSDRYGRCSRRGFAKSANAPMIGGGGEAAPVGRPDFKPGWGRRAILGRFDSCSLPPNGPYVAWVPPGVVILQQGQGNDRAPHARSHRRSYCSCTSFDERCLATHDQPGEDG